LSSRDTLVIELLPNIVGLSEAFISGDIPEQSGPLAALKTALFDLSTSLSARAEQPVFEQIQLIGD